MSAKPTEIKILLHRLDIALSEGRGLHAKSELANDLRYYFRYEAIKKEEKRTGALSLALESSGKAPCKWWYNIKPGKIQQKCENRCNHPEANNW